MEKLIESVKRVRFHRNGVGGESFYAVAFVSEGIPMVATVFDEDRTVAVVDPLDVSFCFRGDNFEDELREAVREWTDDGRAFQEPYEYAAKRTGGVS